MKKDNTYDRSYESYACYKPVDEKIIDIKLDYSETLLERMRIIRDRYKDEDKPYYDYAESLALMTKHELNKARSNLLGVFAQRKEGLEDAKFTIPIRRVKTVSMDFASWKQMCLEEIDAFVESTYLLKCIELLDKYSESDYECDDFDDERIRKALKAELWWELNKTGRERTWTKEVVQEWLQNL